jgi:hypothetical protein
MQQLTGQSGSGGETRLLDVFKGSFKLELPFALSDLFTPEFRFTTEVLKMRMQSSVDVDKSLESKAQALIQRLPSNLQYTMQTRLAFAKFLRSIDFTLKFSDLAELVEHVPAFDAVSGTERATSFVSGSGAYHCPVLCRTTTRSAPAPARSKA